jgi:hypothetical protein
MLDVKLARCSYENLRVKIKEYRAAKDGKHGPKERESDSGRAWKFLAGPGKGQVEVTSFRLSCSSSSLVS